MRVKKQSYQIGGNYIYDPLLSYLRQNNPQSSIPQTSLPIGSIQGSPISSSMVFGNDLQPSIPQRINPSPYISNVSALNPTISPDILRPQTPQGTPDNRADFARLFGALNTGLGAIGQRRENREQQDYLNQVSNNPYMGLLPSSNGQSSGVRYGYRNYQQGGQVDPFDELFEAEYNSLEQDLSKEELKQVKPPTESEVDQALMEQQQNQMRRSFQQQLINEFGQQNAAYNSYERESNGNFTNPFKETMVNMPSANSSDLIDRFKSGIANIESGGARNPYAAKNPNSSALGKYQIIKGTREGIRQRFFPNLDKTSFEDNYKKSPEFQEQVMSAYSSDLLSRFKDPNTAATAFFLGEGKANKVNDPSYRPTKDNATVGQYLNKFSQGFNYMKGGSYYVDEARLAELKSKGIKYKIID